MLNWFYGLFQTRLRYEYNKEIMIAYIDVNKPEKLIIGDDKNAIEGMAQFLTAAGYYVVVRYK